MMRTYEETRRLLPPCATPEEELKRRIQYDLADARDLLFVTAEMTEDEAKGKRLFELYRLVEEEIGR